jgi:hypothetical protein
MSGAANFADILWVFIVPIPQNKVFSVQYQVFMNKITTFKQLKNIYNENCATFANRKCSNDT